MASAAGGGRRLGIWILGALALVLLAGFAALNAFRLQFLAPASVDQIFVFAGLSILAFLIFLGVLFMLVRNVLKLYADQRSRVLGTRLRTRMLWGAVLVSLLPIAFMFSFSYLLMNRAVDRWFSQPVTEMRDDSNRMATELSRYTAANARVEADSISASLEPTLSRISRQRTSHDVDESRAAMMRVLREHEITLQGGFVVVYRDGKAIAVFHMPQRDGSKAHIRNWVPERTGGTVDQELDADATTPAAPTELPNGALIAMPAGTGEAAAVLAAAQRSDEPVLSLGKLDFALGKAGMLQGGEIVVGLPMPYGMAETMNRMHASADAYWTLMRGRRQIRNLYMLLLLMLTSLALFASSWLALHLSKQVTKPVESLADAMEAVAAGDYGRRVQESATDELGELVRSFNRMAEDLEDSRAQVQASTALVSAANRTLEARRGELETMLETIPNGVAMLDRERRLVLTNRSLTEMMDPGGQQPFVGSQVEDVFPTEVAEVLERLMQRSHRMGSASSELELVQGPGTLNLLVTVALLEKPSSDGLSLNGMREHVGYVVVLENATELLRAQKQMAWKEVARRVAHEIKNPLTPISLNAEQIRRHIDRLDLAFTERLSDGENLPPSIAVIRRCSEVVTGSVESMRSLVDQFAALAEFPTALPRPADLNTIVENSLALFAGRMQGVRLVKKLELDLPLAMADPEGMKRALSNLIDNAAEAMQKSLLRELRVTTSLLENGMLELTISDTGAGLTDEMRERLFLPYFSTKQRGTGLGLAIAAKIIQEHGGSIRAEKNSPAGATFIVELKTAPVTETPAAGQSPSEGESDGRSESHSETEESFATLSRTALSGDESQARSIASEARSAAPEAHSAELV